MPERELMGKRCFVTWINSSHRCRYTWLSRLPLIHQIYWYPNFISKNSIDSIKTNIGGYSTVESHNNLCVFYILMCLMWWI